MPDETTPTQTPPPAEAPVENTKILSTLLKLTKPEAADVRPPVEEPAKVEPVKVEEPAKVEPTPEPKKEKVKVKVTPSKELIEAEVKRALAAQTPAPEPAKTPEPAKPEPIPEDLTPEERDEVELVRWAEGKDPARKGLSEKFVKFYRDQKEFLQKRLEEEGDDYDPAKDSRYKKFLDANEPKLTRSERTKLERERLSEEIETRAYERAKKEFAPELETTKAKIREMENRPKVEARVGTFFDEVTSGMPEEVYKFFNENGKDFKKTAEAFPLEYPIIEQVTEGALNISREFLEIRNGIRQFDDKNPTHGFINEFVNGQARAFQQKGGAQLSRNGKTFIPPAEWDASKAANHWTFEDDDVLEMIKVAAHREAKTRIAKEKTRIETAGYVRKPPAAAPISATPPVVQPSEEKSPSTPASPLPGVSKPATSTPSTVVSSLLNFGTR